MFRSGRVLEEEARLKTRDCCGSFRYLFRAETYNEKLCSHRLIELTHVLVHVEPQRSIHRLCRWKLDKKSGRFVVYSQVTCKRDQKHATSYLLAASNAFFRQARDTKLWSSCPPFRPLTVYPLLFAFGYVQLGNVQPETALELLVRGVGPAICPWSSAYFLPFFSPVCNQNPVSVVCDDRHTQGMLCSR